MIFKKMIYVSHLKKVKILHLKVAIDYTPQNTFILVKQLIVI